MRSPEIVIYNHPNPEMKSFLTTVEISAPCVEHFRKPLKKDQEDTAPSFWEEIEKPVIEILNRALRKKQIKMIKG